jgi:hypothetical protein
MDWVGLVGCGFDVWGVSKTGFLAHRSGSSSMTPGGLLLQLQSLADRSRVSQKREKEIHQKCFGHKRCWSRTCDQKMQKKMFRCGESNPDLLGESEKS